MMQRFTLSHSVIGSLVISPPSGWSQARFKLERDPNFHSVSEYFDGSFIFYGSDGVSIDGGFNFIRQVEDIYGPDATIEILIEMAIDDVNYETVFQGQLDLSLSEELINNKIKVPIIRDNFWSKFISRNDTPVDIQKDESMDGGALTPLNPINLITLSQTIRKIGSYEIRTTAIPSDTTDPDLAITIDVPAGESVILDWYDIILDEIETKYNYIISPIAGRVFEIFTAKEDGSYTFDIKVSAYDRNPPPSEPGPGTQAYLEVLFQKNEETSIALDKNDFVVDSGDASVPDVFLTVTVYSKTITETLRAGDQIRISGFNTSGSTQLIGFLGNSTRPGMYDGSPDEAFFQDMQHLIITGDTTSPTTNTLGFLIHDTASQIIERITGQTQPLYSEYLGGQLTQARQYDENGCGWRYGLFKGLQVRQYTLEEKPFFMSFKEWWNGANPILNLGLGYEDLDISPDGQVIRIEQKAHFYDDVPLINFSGVREITRVYDNDYIFNKIEYGYQKWNADDVSGIDDPQAKQTRSTIFQKIGTTIQLFSNFIAASLTFEVARRTKREKSADYKYDNDTFIVSLSETPVIVSPDNELLDFEPELDQGFFNIIALPDEDGHTLLNQQTRYNKRISPARNFVRWLNYFCGALQKNLSSVFKFQSGEGYYKMLSHSTIVFDDGCPGTTSPYGLLRENGDIPVSGNDYLFIPKLFNITLPMELSEYQAIRANRKKAIGISQTQDNHTPFFIKTLEYEHWQGKAVITAWPKTEFTIISYQECGVPPPEEGFIIMETGDYILQEDEFLIEVQ